MSEVQVHFVSYDCVDLRGFIGLNELFINASHFLSKISQWRADAELLNLLVKIDLISLVLYQYTHLRLRQVQLFIFPVGKTRSFKFLFSKLMI